MANSNLRSAKKEKNDEFYTRIEDIEKELIHYKEHFAGKVVFCNCDDPTWSNFYKFFSRKFEDYGLKKLISTHYEENGQSYKLEIIKDINGDGKINQFDEIRTNLQGDGDFRSEECVELLKEADIVVTNPPFSLFREYVAQLMDYNKKFLIIGSMNAITYKETFKLIKENKLWLGIGAPKEFMQPDGNMKKFGNINWFTNLEHKKRNEETILYKKYYRNEDDYPTYDNYDAIEVSKVVDIPIDYNGTMGVPITFLGKFNPKQFKIVGMSASAGYKKEIVGLKFLGERDARPLIKNKNTYARIFVIPNKKVSRDLFLLSNNEFDSFNYNMAYAMDGLDSQVRINNIKSGLIQLKKIYQDYIENPDERDHIFKSIDNILSCEKLGIGEVDSIKLLQIKNKELIRILHKL
jgi:hypothetical protein